MPFGLRVRQLVAPEKVPPPELHRVDAHPPGRDVEQHLAGQRLELPGSAVRGAADGVGVDRLGGEAGAGTRYGPGKSMPTSGRRPDRPRCRDRRRSRTRSRCARPAIAPSASNAIVASPCSWRDLPAARRFSRRSSTHFTGAPTFGAASIRHISSRCTRIFWPNPPPVSRMITRIRCSGMPSRREQNSRTSCGDCVAA